jgi:hypothetical protein
VVCCLSPLPGSFFLLQPIWVLDTLVESITSKKYPNGFYVAWVQINKNYVSFHLMPVYMFPELLEHCSPELKKRMQGKACFNFTRLDEALFIELARLTATSLEHFRPRIESILQQK